MKPRRIVFTVTTDLNYDQRMQRICSAMVDFGYEVVLVGRRKKSSAPLREQSYFQHRLACFFEKGKLFYAEYNIRLFFYLLAHRFDAVCSIDLDSILPGYAVARLSRKPQIYDAHEYFSELEEIANRPFIKSIWDWIERKTVPNIPKGYTVSKGIADIFKEKYNVDYPVVRNVARKRPLREKITQGGYLLYQGAVNNGRGLPELIDALELLPNERLVICGEGDIFRELQVRVKEKGLSERVDFKGYVSPEEMFEITQGAYLGFTLFNNEGLSNHYSLANRFFDYFHAGIPQIAVDYPEYRKFCEQFDVAELIGEVSDKAIALAVQKYRDSDTLYTDRCGEALAAREAHNWETEAEKLRNFYAAII